MKYNDNGIAKDIRFKASDTLPIGAEVEYNGTTVPDGWVEVDDDIIKRDTIAQLNNVVSRNLLPINKFVGQDYAFYKLPINLPAGTYTFSYNTSLTTGATQLDIFDSGENNIYSRAKSNTGSRVYYIFTLTTDGAFVTFYVNTNGTYDEIQIENNPTYTNFVSHLNLEEAMSFLGSNSNGNFIKFNNGIMICYGSLHFTYSQRVWSHTNFSYPETFIQNPVINLTVSEDGERLMYSHVGNVSTSGARLIFYCDNAHGSSDCFGQQ